MRRERIGAAGPWAVLLGLALCLGVAGPAGAVSFNNTDLFILPLQSSEPLDASLQDPVHNVRKLSLSRGDYAVTVSRVQVSGPGSSRNWSRSTPSLHNLTFNVRWNGTVGGVSVTPNDGDELLFVLAELRFGTGSFAASSDLDAGYVRSTFGVGVGSKVISDAFSGPATVVFDAIGAGSLITDAVGGDRYLAARLPLVRGVNQTIKAQMLVAQPVTVSGNFQHFNNAFLWVIPEPGTALLLGAGLLGLAALGRRRRA